MGYGHHLKIEPGSADPREVALTHASELSAAREADWVGLLDLDEYLNVHLGHGTLEELTSVLPASCDAISLSKYDFGSDGKAELSAGPLTARFIHRASDPHSTPSKPLFARSAAALLEPTSPQEIGEDSAQLNRYFCKSLDHLAQLISGLPPSEVAKTIETWKSCNQIATEDTSAQRYDRWTSKYLDMLKSDRRLRQLQEQGLARHQKRAEAASDNPSFAELIAELGQ